MTAFVLKGGNVAGSRAGAKDPRLANVRDVVTKRDYSSRRKARLGEISSSRRDSFSTGGNVH